jgi:hypothetical protein
VPFQTALRWWPHVAAFQKPIRRDESPDDTDTITESEKTEQTIEKASASASASASSSSDSVHVVGKNDVQSVRKGAATYEDVPSATQFGGVARGTSKQFRSVPASEWSDLQAEREATTKRSAGSGIFGGSSRGSVNSASSRGTVGSRIAKVDEVWRIQRRDLTFGKELGSGSFGMVLQAEWHGKKVAVKKIKNTNMSESAVQDFANEVGRMAALQPHENVVTLFGVVVLGDDELGAVVELCARGSLSDALCGANKRTWTHEAKERVAHDAACGVAHLHRNEIVHRDIAARNVLLTKHMTGKVADFGMA